MLRQILGVPMFWRVFWKNGKFLNLMHELMSNTDVPEFWKYIYLGSVDLMLEKWSLANFE